MSYVEKNIETVGIGSIGRFFWTSWTGTIGDIARRDLRDEHCPCFLSNNPAKWYVLIYLGFHFRNVDRKIDRHWVLGYRLPSRWQRIANLKKQVVVDNPESTLLLDRNRNHWIPRICVRGSPHHTPRLDQEHSMPFSIPLNRVSMQSFSTSRHELHQGQSLNERHPISYLIRRRTERKTLFECSNSSRLLSNFIFYQIAITFSMYSLMISVPRSSLVNSAWVGHRMDSGCCLMSCHWLLSESKRRAWLTVSEISRASLVWSNDSATSWSMI